MNPTPLHVIVLARSVAPIHGVGGLERHVHDLVRHLLTHGLRVTLITRRPARAAATDGLAARGEGPAAFGGRCIPLAPADVEPDQLATRFVPYRTFPLAGRRGTTVIDRSTAYPLFGWRAGRLAAKLVRRGGVQLVHGLGASALGYAQARFGDRLETVPFIFNPQGLEEFGATDPARLGLKRLAYRPLQTAVRTCARAADRVIATDRSLMPTVVQHLAVPAARISVIPNAIDLDDLDRSIDPLEASRLREGLGLSADDVLLLAVGRLEENKGFHRLVAALARLQSKQADGPQPLLGERWRLVVLGEGPYGAPLERDIRSAGLGDHILLAGQVSDATLHGWYEAATLFVHPTLYEGSSLVTLEAMAHRRAVVASAAGGLPDKVMPGLNGWLVPPGDAPALAQTIAEALRDRQRLAAMGLESRRIVERDFGWRSVVGRLLDLYEDVLSGRGLGLGTRD